MDSGMWWVVQVSVRVENRAVVGKRLLGGVWEGSAMLEVGMVGRWW